MDPISLRQSFQNANVEALREAQGFNDQVAREAASRKDLQERVAEEQANVPEIPKTDALRTEERKNREQAQGQGGQGRGNEQANEEPQEEAGPAITADGHLDFLA